MKLRQSVRHVAAKRALTLPVLGERVRDWLVDLHVRVFAGRADPEHREARRPRLEAFFDAAMDAYVAALEAGYPEAEAREITHVQANLDFANHGWTEMLEFPLAELDAHIERYADFFDAHGVTRDDPLGDFRTGEVPDAPATPAKLENPESPHAEGGYADDTYVETDGEVGRAAGPGEVDPREVLGLDDESGE
ncbi:MAG: DUF6149 family protein [Halobacteriales archaeon]